MSVKAIRVEDDTLPKNIGEFSLQHDMFRPPYGTREEIFMITPHNRLGALIPEHHSWVLNGDNLSVSPSIVYFKYHGFIRDGWWVDA